MDSLPYLTRLLAYDAWATHETVTRLKELEDPPATSLRVLAHIVASQRVWLGRLHGAAAEVEPWPELTLLQSELQVRDLRRAWREYVDELAQGRVPFLIEYTTSAGESWTSSVEDVLGHVALHSAHHRGQIAAALREAGHDIPATDFIHAARKGFLG